MKVYGVRNGVTCEAEVPDGAVWLEIGSRDRGAGVRGKPLPPISAIDGEARTICRAGLVEPWPERYYREADVEWKPAKGVA